MCFARKGNETTSVSVSEQCLLSEAFFYQKVGYLHRLLLRSQHYQGNLSQHTLPKLDSRHPAPSPTAQLQCRSCLSTHKHTLLTYLYYLQVQLLHQSNYFFCCFNSILGQQLYCYLNFVSKVLPLLCWCMPSRNVTWQESRKKWIPSKMKNSQPVPKESNCASKFTKCLQSAGLQGRRLGNAFPLFNHTNLCSQTP